MISLTILITKNIVYFSSCVLVSCII